MDNKNRKEYPMYRGLLKYFPDALAEVARVSKAGNDQHNKGQDIHWDRSKSTDNADCLLRHLTQAGQIDGDGLSHTAKVAWRALAMLQIELEETQKHYNEQEFLNTVSGVDKAQFHGIPPSLDLCEHEPIKDFDKATAENTKKVRIYLAGPMRGYTDLNFPAFDSAKKKWELWGYEVISPADLDRKEGCTDNRGYVKRDVAAILTCDSIYLLKGWEDSIGASAEYFLARWIGLNILIEGGSKTPLWDFALKHVKS